MKALWLGLVLCLGAGVGTAQEVAAVAQGALLRGLDKINGSAQDLDLANGQSGVFGSLDVVLGECRYPVGDPAGDAFAYLTISEQGAPSRPRCGVMNCVSNRRNPQRARWSVKCARASFDASVRRENMLSPKKAAPSATP